MLVIGIICFGLCAICGVFLTIARVSEVNYGGDQSGLMMLVVPMALVLGAVGFFLVGFSAGWLWAVGGIVGQFVAASIISNLLIGA